MDFNKEVTVETDTVTKSTFRDFMKKVPFLHKVLKHLNHQYERDIFVVSQLNQIKEGGRLIDAGCGNQRYRQYCRHLDYCGQDFGEYSTDDRIILGSDGVGGTAGYDYGPLTYKSDIANIPEADEYFDAVLCTEVFEHIPNPIDAIAEFSRLLKSGGVLILTAPNACLRHMDPYFYYTGFSDNWYKQVLSENGFEIQSLEPVGDYYRYMAAELARSIFAHSFFAKVTLFPAFVYYFFKRKTSTSIVTHCLGYHVVAVKK